MDLTKLKLPMKARLRADRAQFVHAVLDIYQAVARLASQYPEEKLFTQGFTGFDRNHRISYWSYADYLVNDLELWPLLRRPGGLYYAHREVTPYYRGMIVAWKSRGLSSDVLPSREEMLGVLNATPIFEKGDW